MSAHRDNCSMNTGTSPLPSSTDSSRANGGSSHLAPSPPKKAKLEETCQKGDNDDLDQAQPGNGEQQDEEERVFCAAQILSGALDDNLESPAQRGHSVLELFQADDEDSSSCSSLARSFPTTCAWTLNHTRQILQNWSQDCLASKSVNDDDDDDDDDEAIIINSLKSILLVSRHATESSPNTEERPLWKLVEAPLQSVAHVLAANVILEGALALASYSSWKKENGGDHDHGEPVATNDDDTCPAREAQHCYHPTARQHLRQALTLWPTNPAALVALANLVRMGHDTTPVTTTGPQRLAQALDLYRAAAKAAYVLSGVCRALLQHAQFDNDQKFLVETLLEEAAQMTSHTDDECHDDESDENGETPTSDDTEPCSHSKVLVTASLMSATLASALEKHEIAAVALRRFGPHVTRIHPNVWKAATALYQHNNAATDSEPTCVGPNPTQGVFAPCIFPDTVPDDLFRTLRRAFRPDAPYWRQSGYGRNVYYSFWTDWPLPRAKSVTSDDEKSCSYVVSNAVEDYIVTCLLPRVRSVCPKLEDTLCGFEWWVHTRPHGTNLGHQLHFDTDEALLEQDGIVEFPISASVTYLNEDDANTPYGATVLFDQTPSAKENARNAWICAPKSRNFMLFPGDLLHGVLPCIDLQDNTTESKSQNEHYRLTLMVNFWAYRIPDRLKQRKLYGPSGPFPPNTNEHSWIEEICQSYPRTVSLPNHTIDPARDGLVGVSPAWEDLGAARQGSDEKRDADDWDSFWCESTLPMPPSGGINQRFFVTNAPDFFKSTLYEK